ncbi:histone H2A deubiquitinase MYSM1-like [Lineus longissimus]|uniref:histone H2A deubiquitinase MYSM1-like n=1 Tax=Lineus longissimus TaxID=88925 RepID=UPI002B4CD116
MADETELDVDVEGDFDVKIGSDLDFAFDTNEPPSRTVHLQPEFTHHPWVLEQGWSLDNCTDEKSKATIEKMLQEEQYYLNGHRPPGKLAKKMVIPQATTLKRTWAPEEKELFLRGLEIHGRSWTKISEIIQTRTPLQVKNYAQQYFKQQAKFQQSKPLAAATISEPGSCLEATLISVTTAQPTVSVSSRKYSKRSPQKLSLTSHSGRTTSPLKSKAVKTVRQIIQDGMGESEKHVHGDIKIMNLIAQDPTVKKIEKVSDDEDVEIDVEFDDEMSEHSAVDQTASGPGMQTIVVKTDSPADNDKVRDIEDRISVSVAIPSRETQEGKGFMVLVHDTSKEVQESCASSAAVTSSDHEFQQIKMNSRTEEAGLGVSSACEGGEATNILVIETESIDVDVDEPTDREKVQCLTGNDENRELKSSITRCPEKGCVQSESASIDELKMCSENLVLQGLETCNETVGHEVSESESLDEHSSESLTIKTPVTHPEMETVVAGGSQSDETDYEECGGKDDQLMKDGEENASGGYILTSAGECIFFPPPTEEVQVEKETIVEEERQIHSEFFVGRASKTPERYMRIRNYIIDAWEKCKPEYLNKTSVRPGLKNCGDVNSIGRIHAYLEQIGAINFGCEQANYFRRVRPPLPSSSKEKRPESRADRTDPVKSRKRRVRDVFGEWIDESELEGRTIEHKSEEHRPSAVPRARTPKIRKDTYWYDPFKLLPCEKFPSELPAPFMLDMSCSAMAVMDVHAHTSKTEVIGLLGGHYNKERGALEILTAEPCNSLSTGMQCEMDPISQTQAMDRITNEDFSVVGWYHSHPTFAPNPSVRDIETQEKFQDWFSQGGLPFIGVIVNPYNKASQSPCSTFKCLMVRKDKHPEAECHSPFQFDYQVINTGIPLGQLLLKLRDLIQVSAKSSHRVEMLRLYKRTSDVTCLEKMLLSMKDYLRNRIDNMDKLIMVLRDLMMENFVEEEFDS